MPGNAERGSATIWVLMTAALLGLASIAAFVVSAGLVSHRRAASAADLAALAGASTSTIDQGLACGAAEEVAAANGARLTSCDLAGDSVLVSVVIEPPSPWLPPMLVAARAGYSEP